MNLINNQPDIDNIYLYAKDPYETKYQYLINKREKVGLDHFDDPKAFMEYSNDMQDVYKNIEDYNPIKKDVPKNLYNLFEGRKKVLHAFDSKIFPIKTECTGYLKSKPSSFKILTPNQMLKRLPIALAQVKAGNNSEILLNEIRQIVYYLYQSKEITKKVCNNIIKSIKV